MDRKKGMSVLALHQLSRGDLLTRFERDVCRSRWNLAMTIAGGLILGKGCGCRKFSLPAMDGGRQRIRFSAAYHGLRAIYALDHSESGAGTPR